MNTRSLCSWGLGHLKVFPAYLASLESSPFYEKVAGAMPIADVKSSSRKCGGEIAAIGWYGLTVRRSPTTGIGIKEGVPFCNHVAWTYMP